MQVSDGRKKMQFKTMTDIFLQINAVNVYFFHIRLYFFSCMYVVRCTLLQNSQHFYAYMNILTYIHPSICMGKN